MTGETALLRQIDAADEQFLEAMTYEAACAGLREPPAYADFVNDAQLSKSFRNWGKPGDGGLIAEDDTGMRWGAAWYRGFPDAGMMAGRSRTREIIMALQPEMRGRGVGKALLQGLVEHAWEYDGIPLLSLNVVKRNEAALRLYQSVGFRVQGATRTFVGTEVAASLQMTVWADPSKQALRSGPELIY